MDDGERDLAHLGAIALGLGLLLILTPFGSEIAERQIDLTCKPTDISRGKCVSLENGIVESADSEAVRVFYDDGRKSATLNIVGETYPGPRTRVRLERWNGDIVSIYDSATERRYRTTRWPGADSSGAWMIVLFGGLMLAWGLAPGVWTRVQAGREKL